MPQAPHTAGQMRHVLTVERPVKTRRTDGSVHTENHRVVKRIRGQVDPINGREFWEAGHVASIITHRVRTRYDSDLTSEDRLDFNGRKLNVTDLINEGELNQWMTLMCAEKL